MEWFGVTMPRLESFRTCAERCQTFTLWRFAQSRRAQSVCISPAFSFFSLFLSFVALKSSSAHADFRVHSAMVSVALCSSVLSVCARGVVALFPFFRLLSSDLCCVARMWLQCSVPAARTSILPSSILLDAVQSSPLATDNYPDPK